jgi:beta-lactamase regulating signal transducer with metallopeptidase domain
MLHYISQILFFQLCFLLAYELLLKKETFFNYNRWYLLITPVLAILLPLLKLDFLAAAVPENARIMLPAVVIGGETTTEPTPAAMVTAEEATNINWWLVVYGIGLAASFGLFLKKAYNLNKLFRFKETSEEKGFRIIEIRDSNLACTFFSTVFLGDQLSEEEKQQILSHELVHVRQKHSLDLMFFELLKIVLWFNPLIYIYQSRIAGLHEFIADEEVVKAAGKKNYYEQLLNTAFNTQSISFINQFFNHSLIKKRIVMLQKSKSTTVSKLKFLIIIPLMTVMLTYVACSEDKAAEEIQTQQVTEGVLYLEVNDLENLTSEESQKMTEAITQASGNPEYNIVEITDGDKSVRWHENPDKSEANITMQRNDDKTKSSHIDKGDLPYAVIEEVPAFPGCEGIESNEERKQCTSQKITEFLNNNFNTDLGKELGLKGTNRVIVQFKIAKDGTIQKVRSRAAAPELEEEAERVIKSLPVMTPGRQNGEAVGVMYSLPIVFQVNE